MHVNVVATGWGVALLPAAAVTAGAVWLAVLMLAGVIIGLFGI